MLDLFTIFSKSGIVLWCFQRTTQLITPPVNALIKNVILEERAGASNFSQDGLTFRFKLDNEFELIYVVAYQKFLQLTYIDKFLDDVQKEFRDKYKQELDAAHYYFNSDFQNPFDKILKENEEWSHKQAMIPKPMRSYQESNKSKKTIASMTQNKQPPPNQPENKINKKNSVKAKNEANNKITEINNHEAKNVITENTVNDSITLGREKFAKKMTKGKDKNRNTVTVKEKRNKEKRQWGLSGGTKDIKNLDFSNKPEGGELISENYVKNSQQYYQSGSLEGEVPGMDYSSSEPEGSDDDEEEDEEAEKVVKQEQTKSKGMFSMFKSLVGSKNISQKDMEPILNKLRDHMIGKNVAIDIAEKLCSSISNKLEGKVLGTFTGIHSTVKATLDESLIQLLSPKRRIDILRDVMESQKKNKPYVMSFCGVNGVGKSTNLAKIAFWLTENKFRVLIAACDTFRAGAVEQLRTHTKCLNDRPGKDNMVQLYEKGYGKDAAGIAMEAINYARDTKLDVVLIDTAGRMQDNEPLMRALAKLIKVNNPDLVLFVGEALVGNEAVDQLTKFNQALADHSIDDNPHLLDGIVLTKFDTIDDKVGAAISMTYITGQPIIFVGTGQTYTDLKTLNPKAVVRALMK